MNDPFVVIVLVNYNNAADTIECVESLAQITYSNVRTVVVDNGSSDASLEKLTEAKQKYSFELIDAGTNGGFSAGNNIGIVYALEADADYILLLNNDTLVEPDFLTELIKVHGQNSQCDLTIGKIYYAYDRPKLWYAGGTINSRTGRTVHERYGEIDTDLSDREPREVSFATGCCICMKAEVARTVGLLDEDYFLYEEDCDYSLRVAQKGKHIFYVPTSVIYHKVSASTGEASPSSQYYTARNHMWLIKKHFKGLNRWIATGYAYLLFAKRCLAGELNWSHTFSGIRAYYRGEKGKRNQGENK